MEVTHLVQNQSSKILGHEWYWFMNFLSIKHWNQASTQIYLDSADTKELSHRGNSSGPALI